MYSTISRRSLCSNCDRYNCVCPSNSGNGGLQERPTFSSSQSYWDNVTRTNDWSAALPPVPNNIIHHHEHQPSNSIINGATYVMMDINFTRRLFPRVLNDDITPEQSVTFNEEVSIFDNNDISDINDESDYDSDDYLYGMYENNGVNDRSMKKLQDKRERKTSRDTKCPICMDNTNRRMIKWGVIIIFTKIVLHHG